ncbi:OmpA family protein [Microbulbifer echini]|uniref:OmpA family protein n=1 Tax=Microbulbifer echini TaxID=1529067 RepID=A0ABV4NPH4_9GAMM|nr:OmpA family protein [uncultured Microbulbifer sp.]
MFYTEFDVWKPEVLPMADKPLVVCCLVLLVLLLAGCPDPDPNRKYALKPLAEVQSGEGEKVARQAAPFGDDLVRFLRGSTRKGGDTFRLRLEFAPGGFAPQMDSIADLEALLVIMRDFPEMRIAIEGHTDNDGDPKKNLHLSQWRADWVRNFLIERGIDSERMQAQGYGDTDPIADNESKKGQRENRRLVIRVLNFDRMPSRLPQLQSSPNP